MLAGYVSYLHEKRNLAPISLKAWVTTAKKFLEFWDVDISPRKFKIKVKMPRVVQQSKEALTKEDIVNILNACPDLKLKTYVLFLAATGARATEVLSTRLRDYDFAKGKVFIRGEFTKTRVDRFLTRELQAQLKTWIDFKYRARRISNPKNGKSLMHFL